MQTLTRSLEQIAERLKKAERICIVGHLNPDGDCIGSMLALRYLLVQQGKTADVYDRDPAPGYMKYLHGFDSIRPLSSLQATYDVMVSVDCAGLDRIVDVKNPEQNAWLERMLASSTCHLQIDHHGTNPMDMDINAVDGDASAAGILIWKLSRILGFEMDTILAECLYTAVSTDTGNFMQDNTSAECFDLMSEIARTQIRLPQICRILFAQRSHGQVGLITRALQTLRYAEADTVTGMLLTAEDMQACQALPEDADPVAKFGRVIRGVHMTVLARESPEGVKMSFRSIAPWKIDMVARSFGGGGHAHAAGCTVRDKTAAEALDAAMNALILAHRAQEEK